MKRIGFIGFGVMGSPMAANLVRAGFDVAGHTRRRAGVDRLVAAGGRAAGAAVPVGALVAQLMAALRAAGHGGLDHTALLRLTETLSGLFGADPGVAGRADA